MSEGKENIMLCCPDLKEYGGVANYYRVIRKHKDLYKEITFFEINIKSQSLLEILFKATTEIIRFTVQLGNKDVRLIHLNPSFLRNALLRDGVLLILARCFGKKVIVFWRGWHVPTERTIVRRFSPLFRFVFNRADLTLVLANEVRRKLLGIGITHPILITTTLFDQDLIPKKKALDNHGKTQRLLFMSRLVKEKGIYETIEAFKILKKEFRNISLDVAGDGPELTKLKKKYEQIDALQFHGHVNDKDKYQLMVKSNIFVLPSYREGMPNSILEAMACGLPIVTCPVGSLKDFFVHGEHGYLLNNNNPKDLAQLISNLIKDVSLSTKISLNNITYAYRHFSADKSIRYLNEAYRAVLNNRIADLPSAWY
ncbi:MAG: glycosyltransferase [Deltaproteobacteria bacterium]|nr:glycosyltransferase [Deltaproteobacteria bacterium]